MFDPIKFIRESREELEKVTWPTKNETIRLTKVVIVASLIVSLYLGTLDYIFNELFKIFVL